MYKIYTPTQPMFSETPVLFCLKVNFRMELGISLINHFLLDIYYVASTLLGARETVKNKDNKFPHKVYIFYTPKCTGGLCCWHSG